MGLNRSVRWSGSVCHSRSWPRRSGSVRGSALDGAGGVCFRCGRLGRSGLFCRRSMVRGLRLGENSPHRN
jgi:hypothetical protein